MIAYLAFKRTLEQQRRQFRAQALADEERLEQQARAQREQLDEQLAAQDAALREQLDAQRESIAAQIEATAREAAKERELEVRAELVQLLSGKSRTPDGLTDEELVQLDKHIFTAIQRWRLNLSTEIDWPLRSELLAWQGLIADVMGNGSTSSVSGDRSIILARCFYALENVAINYRERSQSGTWTPEFAASYLRSERKSARSWIESAYSVLYDDDDTDG